MRLIFFLFSFIFNFPVLAELPCNLCPSDEKTRTDVVFGLAIVDGVEPWKGSDLLYAEDDEFPFFSLQQEQTGHNGEFFSNRLRFESPEFNRWELSAGRQGDWSLDINLNSYQIVSTNNSQTIFSGVATNDLSLPDNWITGSTTTAMPSLNENLTPIELSMQHQDLLIAVSKEMNNHWQFNFSLTEKKHDGLRDVGGVIGTSFANARVVILPAQIDSTTTDFELTANYNRDNTSLAFSYLISNYDQGANPITWENAYSNQFSVPVGEIGQAPDNSFHQLSINGGYLFSNVSRLNFSLAYGQYLQNQSFSQYTVNNVMLFDALPTDSLDGRIDSLIANIRYAQELTERMSFDINYQYNDQDNQTASELYNYVIADTQVSPTERSNIAYSYRKQKLHAKIRYRLNRNTRFQLGANHAVTERDNQEVEELTSDEIWSRVAWQPTSNLDLSLRASQTRQRGSEYGTLDFLTTTPENPLLRKYNLADQDSNRVLFVASQQIGTAVSLGLRLVIADVDYPDTEIGLTSTSESGAYIDLIYALTDNYSMNVFLGQDNYESKQSGSIAVSTPDWEAKIDEQAISAGVEFNWKTASGKFEQEIGWNRITADLNVTVGNSNFPQADSSIDRITYEGTYHSSDTLSYSLKFLYERYTEEDWASDDVAPDTISNILALGDEFNEQDSIAVVIAAGYRF